VFAGGEDRHDRRMFEARDDLDLAAEPFARALEEQQVRAHDLERHRAPQTLLLGDEHDPHATGAEPSQQPEVAEPLRDRRARVALQQPHGAELRDQRQHLLALRRMLVQERRQRGLAAAVERFQRASDQVFERATRGEVVAIGRLGGHRGHGSALRRPEEARAQGRGWRSKGWTRRVVTGQLGGFDRRPTGGPPGPPRFCAAVVDSRRSRSSARQPAGDPGAT
jgi:hypothetical protein